MEEEEGVVAVATIAEGKIAISAVDNEDSSFASNLFSPTCLTTGRWGSDHLFFACTGYNHEVVYLNPKNRSAFSVVTRAKSSMFIPRSFAIASAVSRTKAGSQRFPR